MAAAEEGLVPSYEDLAELEREFDDVETEIIRQQLTLTAPLYKKRLDLVSRIPNFWPLVLEQAPPEIDQYIQPSDSALLLSSLLSIQLDHFEMDISPKSFSIKFEFKENEHFGDTTLEKKFWFRRAKDGWSGLVSEPVPIEWKTGKDLTGGLLDLVLAAERSLPKDSATNGKEKAKKALTKEQSALKKKIDATGMGGLSFFAWFGFIGRRISATDNAEATAEEEKKRKARKDDAANGSAEDKTENMVEDEDEDDITDEMELEVFHDGDELAIAFSEDLWPGAVKYFTQAQEQEALSDADFESADDLDLNDVDEEDDGEDDRPKKKVKH